MTSDEIEALFEKHQGEYLEFSRITDPSSACMDLHAFSILGRLSQVEHRMARGAHNSRLFLNVSDEGLMGKITEQDIIDLIRCGVQRSNLRDYWMFV